MLSNLIKSLCFLYCKPISDEEKQHQTFGKWSELRKSERRKPKRTPKIDFRRSDLL